MNARMGRMGRGGYADVPKEKGVQIRVVKRLSKYLKKYPIALLVVFFAVIITSAASLALPYVLQIAIDNFIVVDAVNLEMLAIIFGALIIVSIFISFMNWILQFLMSIVASKVTRDLRDEAFRKLQDLPIRYYDKRAHGEIMSTITNDVETIFNGLSQVVPQLISAVILLFGSVILMFFTSWQLTLINFAVFPIMIFLTIFITTKAFKYFGAQQENLGQVNGITKSGITGLKAVKLYNQENEMIEKFEKANQGLQQSSFKAQIYSGMVFPLVGLVNNLLYALLISIGTIFHIQGVISVGKIQAMTNYSKMFTRPISNIAQIFNVLQAAVAGGDRLFKLIDEPSEYQNDTKQTLKTVKGKVEFQNVHFSYEKGTKVLNDINFVACPGQVVAIVGPTGSGKTTIINLMTRFYDIDEGIILLDDHNIYDLSKDYLRHQVGIVLQTTYLFKGTIYDNIRYGRMDATEQEVIEAAKLAHVHDIIERLPRKYQTKIKEGGNNFSHGERQLISIARTILSNPKVLVLDEATSSVDTRTESKIQKSMQTLMKNRTSFVIAHRLQTIKNADIILVIKDGEIVEKGNHDALLKKQGMYYDMYTTQFSMDN